MVISKFQGLSAEVAASALHSESYKQTLTKDYDKRVSLSV